MTPDVTRETDATLRQRVTCKSMCVNGRAHVYVYCGRVCLPVPTDPRHQAAPPLTVLSALSPFTVGVGHGHRRNHSHARLAAHAAASYLPNGTSVLTAADSKRLFHPPPWMVGFVAKLPPGLRAVEPIELILLVGAMTVGVLVWAAASTVSRQKAALRKANAAGDEAALLQQAHEEATYLKLRNRYLSVYMLKP